MVGIYRDKFCMWWMPRCLLIYRTVHPLRQGCPAPAVLRALPGARGKPMAPENKRRMRRSSRAGWPEPGCDREKETGAAMRGEGRS